MVQPKVRRPVKLSSLYDNLDSAGKRPHTDVLSFAAEEPSELVAQALAVARDSKVYAFERLQYAGDEPLSIMRNWVPTDVVALDADALPDRGFYQILRTSGVTLKIASESIGGRAARAAEARLLHEKAGAPLLAMTARPTTRPGGPLSTAPTFTTRPSTPSRSR